MYAQQCIKAIAESLSSSHARACHHLCADVVYPEVVYIQISISAGVEPQAFAWFLNVWGWLTFLFFLPQLPGRALLYVARTSPAISNI